MHCPLVIARLLCSTSLIKEWCKSSLYHPHFLSFPPQYLVKHILNGRLILEESPNKQNYLLFYTDY